MRRESVIVAESAPRIDIRADVGRAMAAWHTAPGTRVLTRVAPELT